MAEDPNADALDQLQMFKQARVEVSQNLARAHSGLRAVESAGEKLGAVMKFLRAVERGIAGEISVCLQIYPGISSYVSNPYLCYWQHFSAFDGFEASCG